MRLKPWAMPKPSSLEQSRTTLLDVTKLPCSAKKALRLCLVRLVVPSNAVKQHSWLEESGCFDSRVIASTFHFLQGKIAGELLGCRYCRAITEWLRTLPSCSSFYPQAFSIILQHINLSGARTLHPCGFVSEALSEMYVSHFESDFA